MSKTSFILYYNHREIFNELTDEEAGQLIKAVFDYEIDGSVSKDKFIKTAMIPIKQVLDKNKEDYEEICNKNRENVLKRWNKNKKDNKKEDTTVCDRIRPHTTRYETIPKILDIDIDIDNKENNNTKVLLKERNKKPTIEEIKAYCLERNNNVDAEKFYDYYESNGWMVGKNKMKDWKASVRTWEKNTYNNATNQEPKKEQTLKKTDGGWYQL